jgi:hypothetical protein
LHLAVYLAARPSIPEFKDPDKKDMALGTLKKVAIVNGGSLVGIAVSLFIVPPTPPMWVWAIACVLCLSVLNFFLFRRVRKGSGERKVSLASSLVVGLGFGVLLLELVFLYWRR